MLIARLKEIASEIAKGDAGKFRMSIPAQLDYDTGVVYETEWKASDTQKIRDAEKDFDIKEPQ